MMGRDSLAVLHREPGDSGPVVAVVIQGYQSRSSEWGRTMGLAAIVVAMVGRNSCLGLHHDHARIHVHAHDPYYFRIGWCFSFG